MDKKKELLGVAYGTARNKLIKNLLWNFVRSSNLNICFQCNEKINNIEDLSIEHKIPWQSAADPISAFYDLENIAYSHLKCNMKAGGKLNTIPCESRKAARKGCNCDYCKSYNKARWRKRWDSMAKEERVVDRRKRYINSLK
jgi:hypothetical protein